MTSFLGVIGPFCSKFPQMNWHSSIPYPKTIWTLPRFPELNSYKDKTKILSHHFPHKPQQHQCKGHLLTQLSPWRVVQESPIEQTTTQNKKQKRGKLKYSISDSSIRIRTSSNCASVCLTQGVKLIQVKSLIELQSMFKPKTDKILPNLLNPAGLVS